MESRVKAILDYIRGLSQKVFGENLVGVYVHGSLALGCFHWDKSDIDFIVVVKAPMNQADKEAYITGLLHPGVSCPPKGLEMSVVLESYAKRFVYPTPFELHYSNMHLKACTENITEYCHRMNGTDKDLAAHFTMIRSACILLCGKPVQEVFDTVPQSDFWDSLCYDIENAADDILKNPAYIILNLCRVLGYRKDGLILSKKSGAEWGLRHLNQARAELVQSALNSYETSETFPTAVSPETLRAFAAYMLEQIYSKEFKR